MLSHRHWLEVKGISVAHFSKTILISLSCPCWMSLSSVSLLCRFIAHLFSVTTLSVIDLVGKEQNKPVCLCSLEWNVWLLWAQLVLPPWQQQEFPAQWWRHDNLHHRDPEGFQHSGASTSGKQTAASTVLTMLVFFFFGNGCRKQWREDREILVSSQSKKKRDRDQNVVHSWREINYSQNPWTESWLGSPRRENGSTEIVWSWGGNWGRWPGGWVPQNRSPTGGGGLSRVPNLRVCKHLGDGVAHAEWEGWNNVLPWYRLVGVVSTFCLAHGGKTGLPARVSGRHVVRGRQSLPILESAQVTGKAGEKRSSFRRPGGTLILDKTVGSRVWWHIQGHSELRLDPGWGSGQSGSGVAIDWVTGWSCSSPFCSGESAQCTVRPTWGWRGAGIAREPVRALPSVIVGTEKVSAGSGWAGRKQTGGKVVDLGALPKPTLCAGEEPEDHKCNQEWISTISAISSKSMGRSGSER